jgi:hypothetical protein
MSMLDPTVRLVAIFEGLGGERQAARLLGSSAAVIVHRMPHPEAELSPNPCGDLGSGYVPPQRKESAP